MKNPLRFIQEVKQEAFKITWPTKKDTLTGGLTVFALASIAALFFLLLDQILRGFHKFFFFLPGPEEFEPQTSGFGDRRSTN